jgi:hypothetical protein
MAAKKGKRKKLQSQWSLIWLAFDLGVQGDYEALYAWLDERKAKECGENVAVLSFGHRGDLRTVLTKSLKKFGPRARVYVVQGKKDGGTVGAFLIGKRGRARWEGYGPTKETEEDALQ